MNAIDLLRHVTASEMFQAFQWQPSVGESVAVGRWTDGVVRGDESIAFVLVPTVSEFVGGAGAAGYWDLAVPPIQQSLSFANWVSALDIPGGTRHLILLTSGIWSDGEPGSLGDGPESGAWLLPRMSADVARTLRWALSLQDGYLRTLRDLGYPAPFSGADPSPEVFILRQAGQPPLVDLLRFLIRDRLAKSTC
jgi:hypothetical protein